MGTEYSIEIPGPGYDETQHMVRIVCLVITLLSNFFLFGYMLYNVFITKNKKLNIILGMAMFYVSCTIFAALYNLLYRFTINIDGCESSDIFEELVVAFTRSILLLFYVVMISKVFENSKQALNSKFQIGLIIFIIVVQMILLPVIGVSLQTYTAIKTPSYGIYCRNNHVSNDVATTAVILYQIIDVAITIILCIVFLYKLRQLLHELSGNDDVNNHHDDIEVDKNEIIQQLNAKAKLLKLVKKALTLTIISIVSSWIIIFGGRIDTNGKTAIRWIYPLDYMFNGWCVFLFFDWPQFQCLCLKNKEIDFDTNTDIHDQKKDVEITQTETR